MRNGFFWISFVIGASAMVGDFLVPTLLARKYPGYSHLRDTISTLGTTESPVKSQTSVWLVGFGVCLLVFAAGQASRFQLFTWRHVLYLAGIVGFGIGAGVLAGFFPEDAPGAAETVSGKVHGIGSGLGSILLLLTPLWALGMSEFAQVKNLNTLGFAVAMVAFIFFLVSGKGGLRSVVLTGLWQRLYLAALYGTLLLNSLMKTVTKILPKRGERSTIWPYELFGWVPRDPRKKVCVSVR
jgi:hypothetical protein